METFQVHCGLVVEEAEETWDFDVDCVFEFVVGCGLLAGMIYQLGDELADLVDLVAGHFVTEVFAQVPEFAQLVLVFFYLPQLLALHLELLLVFLELAFLYELFFHFPVLDFFLFALLRRV